MTIDEMIVILKRYREENGDLPVYITRDRNERSVPVLEFVNEPMKIETKYTAIAFPAEKRVVIR
jgi:hypothetical protein